MNRRIDRRRVTIGALGAPLLLASGAARANPVDADRIARAFADLVRREYHDPAVGETLADRVERKIADGAYAALEIPSGLADALMKDAIAVTKDKHFFVAAGMHHGMAPSIRPGARKPQPDPAFLEQMRREGFGIANAEIAEGGVGVIDLRRFYSPYEETKAAIGTAMQPIEGARSLVFDLTQNIGGDPASVALWSSYLFERAPFVINRFRWRSSGVEEFTTTRALAGPVFPESRPVFIAVSSDTFSAGEEFTYNLQALRRAEVVGEQTAGGANHAEMFPLGGDIVAFIPCARAENPVTGGNWEGVGVKPDHFADRSNALEAALRLARAG